MAGSDSAFGLIDPEKLGQLEWVAPGLGMIHGFANVAVALGSKNLLLVDASSTVTAGVMHGALRRASPLPVEHLVYTHGHVDHVGGAKELLGIPIDGSPSTSGATIWSHVNVPDRFERYRMLWGWNNEVNRRQFGMPKGTEIFPKGFVAPTRTYDTTTTFKLDSETVELHHAQAETDDATWVHLPERRAVLVGDLMIHSMPNAGNPNKPQRFTLGWATALDSIAQRQPHHLLPGHGPPLSGPIVMEVLEQTARALRYLHDTVVDRMNAGQWPDEIAESGIRLPPDLENKFYLRPIYGCVPFIVRDVLRMYAGWWGGHPSTLLPNPRRTRANDLVEAAGRKVLFDKASALFAGSELKRALDVVMVLVDADPHDREARALAARVLEQVAESESSFIARNFYRAKAIEYGETN